MLNANHFMQLAVDKAWQYQLLTYPNPAVGATIVQDGKVLSCEAHIKAGGPHAEVNAIKSAFLVLNPSSELKKLTSSLDIHNFLIANHNNIFTNCEIYVTLEPCNHIGKTPSCASLLKELKFNKVIVGKIDPNKQAAGGIATLKNANILVESIQSKECDELLLPFKKWNKDKFIFFKLAMREDGSVTGGYITTKQSLTHVHHLRTLIDTLVIGGNTVRIDRPTLDTRFIKGSIKNPNILIYSNDTKIDKSIPLFNIENRDVKIDNSLKYIENDNFIMIEGGYKLLEVLKDKIDMLMIFMSTNNPSNTVFDPTTLGFDTVYEDNNKEDKIIYMI